MGLAAPSLADASRRLPSVKTGAADADDDLVTSVSFALPLPDEPVSPELALVDPVLAARLRALLPEIEIDPPETNVRMLRLAPPVAEAASVSGSSVPGPEPGSWGGSFRRMLASFLAGAVVASVVVVGVIAERGELDNPIESSPVTVPPRVGQSGDSGKPAVKNGSASQSSARAKTGAKGAKPVAKAPKNAAARKAAKKPTSQKGAKKPEPPKIAKQPSRGRAAKPTTAKTRAAPPAAEPRRFAWAPVAGAVGYRVELFRGDDQVLRATTKDPTFELAPRWRHGGRVERLTPGSYRWYVWPVLPGGAATKAVVQARLTIP